MGNAAASKDRHRISQAKAAWLLLLLFVVAGIGWLGFVWLRWPDVARLADENPATTAFIERYRGRQREAGEPDDLLWEWTSYDEISSKLKGAILVAEDVEFFTHDGFSRMEIRAAIEDAIQEGAAPRGASTITQQLAKNLWLSPERTAFRKLKEAILTRQLERYLSKDRIFELYLNVGEFGPGIFGAGAAARHYFDKPAAELTEWEASLLAAALPRPADWHPGVRESPYLARAERIEYRMYEVKGYLQRYVGGW